MKNCIKTARSHTHSASPFRDCKNKKYARRAPRRRHRGSSPVQREIRVYIYTSSINRVVENRFALQGIALENG